MRTAADFVPDATTGSATRIDIAVPPDIVWQAIEHLSADDLMISRLLVGVRSIPAMLIGRGRLRRGTGGKGSTLIESMIRGRFVMLHREPGRILTMGIVGRFWLPTGGEDAGVKDRDGFVAFAEPGFVKSAIDLELLAHGSGTRLVTRTCNRPTDDGAARRFGRYWRVIGPGSKLIRVDLLRAIRRRAEATAG
jgi:hypothetical protein